MVKTEDSAAGIRGRAGAHAPLLRQHAASATGINRDMGRRHGGPVPEDKVASGQENSTGLPKPGAWSPELHLPLLSFLSFQKPHCLFVIVN